MKDYKNYLEQWESSYESCTAEARQAGFDEGHQKGRVDREAEIVTIIEQMRESASAMMWTEREVACEKILEQIKEQKNE